MLFILAIASVTYSQYKWQLGLVLWSALQPGAGIICIQIEGHATG